MKSNKLLLRLPVLVIAGLISLLLPAEADSQTGTVLRVWPESLYANTCEETHVAIRVENVTGLTAYSLQISFAPDIVEIVEIKNGSFLEAGFPEPSNGIDQAAGIIQFGMAQVGSSGKSGSGDLLRIKLKALLPHQTARFTIDASTSVLVSWPDAQSIPYRSEGGVITTLGCYSLYLPLIAN